MNLRTIASNPGREASSLPLDLVVYTWDSKTVAYFAFMRHFQSLILDSMHRGKLTSGDQREILDLASPETKPTIYGFAVINPVHFLIFKAFTINVLIPAPNAIAL